jgi:hypothetical protein
VRHSGASGGLVSGPAGGWESVGVFVVDDLVGWLIGRLADAGYQKLITLLRGSDQARGLKAAVTAAVQATVDEIGPSDREEAERVAEQINKAFHRREPVPLPRGQPTLLEALQAGIAGQLSALDDVGQPTVSLPGVSVTDMGAKLTGHLVRQIQIRGSRGGPLADLADQLNHDLTHLQGQRLEGMLAQVLDWLGDTLGPSGGVAGPVGSPLSDVRDPFALEVHRPVEPDVPQPGLPLLPVYVPREHDTALAQVVTAAAAGTSGIAMLVGGSSTGKTRACWQALDLLRDLEPEWRLWHPIDPQAALAQLSAAGPRTVMWLNEAQRYLDTPDGTGERVGAGLRELLRDRARGPVLVLATLWPDYWAQMTARPPEAPDPHAQARELLTGHNIRVPSDLTPVELRELEVAGDPRLAQAAAGSRDGQVIQYLAGAPELLDRYHNATPAARALIDAAMDARRLGMRAALAQAFLETAAPGYVTDTEWDLLPDEWLKQALGYTAALCKGVRGPLAPIHPRPSPGVPADLGGGPTWQLADYLDQHGRRVRRELIPPGAFWAAAASCADPGDLATLAQAAENRGLSRDAAHLYKRASVHGYPEAGARLVRLLYTLHPDDQRPADWAVAHASPDNPGAVVWLLLALHRIGATGQVTTLADQAAAHASLDNPAAVADLLDALYYVGATGQVTTVGDRDPAGHASLDNPFAVAKLLGALRGAATSGQATILATRAAAHANPDNALGMASLLYVLHQVAATGQVTTLATRAAAHANLDDPRSLSGLLNALHYVGATGQVTTLANRDPAAHISLDDPDGVATLLYSLSAAGATSQVTTLATRAAHASPNDPATLARLLDGLRVAGATSQVTTLASRAAMRASLDNPLGVAGLLDALREAGTTGQVTTLLDRDPAAHTRPDDPGAVARLLRALDRTGATGQVTTLASRAASHASLDNPLGVAGLLAALREAGAASQVTSLLDRDPAAHTSLNNPLEVARLLDALREAGATGQVTSLLDRGPAAHASLDDSDAVANLLGALRNAGATGQGAELIGRLPAAGLFQLFCTEAGREDQFRFGRDADGRPAKRWTWTDLG